MDQPASPDLPGFTNVALPEEHREHPLLNDDSSYFTLPGPLLSQVVHSVGEQKFEDSLLELEIVLSDLCEDHVSRIGFWRGQPISYQLLRSIDLSADKNLQRHFEASGQTKKEAATTLASLNERRNWAVAALRGYCGWLMTNPTFLEEHQQILQTWKNEVAQDGIPRMGPVVRDASALDEAELAKGQTKKYLTEFEDFFIRWRLDGMPAPFMPQPIGVHLPVSDLRPVLGHMRHGGTTFYLPDICPVPSRDLLRNTLEDALRDPSAPSHIQEWFEIVQSDNAAKNKIPRYARIFELQHYMRALYARHGDKLRLKKSALRLIFAQYLGISEDSIERDVQLIAHRLGPNWYLPSA